MEKNSREGRTNGAGNGRKRRAAQEFGAGPAHRATSHTKRNAGVPFGLHRPSRGTVVGRQLS
ncbi:hypothetical protein J31TS4_31090 [Paenibacillus sp. J31TS4]|nr:hypothetical protein J31TS4_31090 [Paenibacillus sp. J31TS4]